MPLIPDRSWPDPLLGAMMHTGRDALTAVIDLEQTTAAHSVPVAMDIETPGLNTFTINCITAAWELGGQTHAVLLDPRTSDCRPAMVAICRHASTLIFHSSPFDVPILAANGLLTPADINKVVDTLIHARMATPDRTVPKKLEACAIRYLGLAELKGGMETAFRAAGYTTQQAGYEGMSVESPIYRLGAMGDTVVTLKLEPVLRRAVGDWLTDHPFVHSGGASSTAEAEAILHRQQVVNRVMLRRSATGLAVDRDHLIRYAEQVDGERHRAEATLASAGLVGGAGKGPGLIKYLDAQGQLPQPWPRTPKGALRATKSDLDELHHPLAQAQRLLATIDRVNQYIEKVTSQADVTGRCHPQVNVLGASETGRLSVSNPEYHQFSANARAIFTDDGQGLTSIDWTTIEPVTMAVMARDDVVLAPYEAGHDLYEPIGRATGQPRDTNKVVLLAGMYGESSSSLARRIKHTEESAAQIRRQMFLAMPACTKWMNKVASVGKQYGKVITAGGRILPVGIDPKTGKQLLYKLVNHVVQGSAYDILAHTVVVMEHDGIGDHIQLTMHDEVVVDTEVAEHVQHIMETAPEFLERQLGRSLTLRTDRKDLGHAWAKV